MPEIIFNGPDGRLEGRYHPQHDNLSAPIALILHPHPLYGGTMNNKVVYTLFHAFVKRGFAVMRFNFRGVGRSQGVYDQGVGELADAAAALDWLQTQNGSASQCWVAGFSFGAWIGMQLLMRRPEIERFVSVSAPAGMFDFTFLAPCPSSGLFVHGEKDPLIPEGEAQKLAHRLAAQRDITIDYKSISNADHFYEGKLDQLEIAVSDYIEKEMSKLKAA